MPDQSVKRGAIPAPRHALAAAMPYAAPIGAAPQLIRKPAQISMWGNDVHGDCVTAEEAFAKACNNPEIFIQDDEVIAWATAHGVLEGAFLTDVMTWMENDGFIDSSHTYDDGPYFSVNWTDAGVTRSAISQGPVKIGVAADQIETAYNTTSGQSGWFGTGFHHDDNEDHCVALCGYGSISWLAQQLGVAVPAGVDGTQPGYALFTWNSIGIVDVPSMIAITHEAWLRRPTTVTGTAFAIASANFPNVHLRMDGTGVTTMTGAGGGTVNCQYGVGAWERFRVQTQADGTVAIASANFPNVHLRMDGTGVTTMTGAGGGTVNCQYGVGAWERFRVQTQADGTVAIASANFPNVHLRMDGTGVTTMTGAGGGTVNCQYGVGPWERFRLET